MGFGSAGATKGNTGFRLDTGRGGSDIVKIWQRQPEVILQAAARLKKVLIENCDALKVIEDHEKLIKTLKLCKGMVIVCGYEHPIYESLKWKKIKKTVAAAGQAGSVMREEVLWINSQAENQQDLFGDSYDYN